MPKYDIDLINYRSLALHLGFIQGRMRRSSIPPAEYRGNSVDYSTWVKGWLVGSGDGPEVIRHPALFQHQPPMAIQPGAGCPTPFQLHHP